MDGSVRAAREPGPIRAMAHAWQLRSRHSPSTWAGTGTRPRRANGPQAKAIGDKSRVRPAKRASSCGHSHGRPGCELRRIGTRLGKDTHDFVFEFREFDGQDD